MKETDRTKNSVNVRLVGRNKEENSPKKFQRQFEKQHPTFQETYWTVSRIIETYDLNILVSTIRALTKSRIILKL